jgi:hypothetical protein
MSELHLHTVLIPLREPSSGSTGKLLWIASGDVLPFSPLDDYEKLVRPTPLDGPGSSRQKTLFDARTPPKPSQIDEPMPEREPDAERLNPDRVEEVCEAASAGPTDFRG